MFHQLLNVVVALAIITDSLALPTCACGAVESDGANSATAPTTPRSCCGDHGQGCCRRAKSSTEGKPGLSTAARQRKSCCRSPAKRSQEAPAAHGVIDDSAECGCHATSPVYLLASEAKPTQAGVVTAFAALTVPVVPLSCSDQRIEAVVERHRPTALQRCVELRRLLI